ncbi:MAG: hypothetical protein JWM40_387 [Frankiales bacterium]|nr:hypothetical protein [Frankiales bacterium]
MPSPTFDDEGFQAAARAYVAACDALDLATAEADVLTLADAKVLAGLNLRKVLVGLGWTAPLRSHVEG